MIHKMQTKKQITIMNQKETLDKVIQECLDDNFAKIGKVALMCGIKVKDLMALHKEQKPLSESDFAKLKQALIDYKK